MFKYKSLFTICFLIGCGSPAQSSEDHIPDICFEHSPRAFHEQVIDCVNADDKCAFNAHNKPTPLDGSVDPLAYYCTCSIGYQYVCWGSPSFVKADPLP